MSFREAGVTDEKIAIDFVASAHTSANVGAGCTRAPTSHVFLVKFHRTSDRLKGVYKRPTMFGNCKREENRKKIEDVVATRYITERRKEREAGKMW